MRIDRGTDREVMKNIEKNQMRCVEVYKKLYHQEPFDIAFCPYRIFPY